MEYNRKILENDMVYSIDYFQIDFGLGGLSDDVVEMFKASLELQKQKMFGLMELDNGIKHFAQYDLAWWQFDGLHIEVCSVRDCDTVHLFCLPHGSLRCAGYCVSISAAEKAERGAK